MSSPNPTSPLAAWQQRHGARPSPRDGFETPADYGSVDDEYRALRDACGVFDRTWTDRLEMIGADRARFLNGRLTCDVKPLEAGGGIYGFITTAKGRIFADVGTLALEDRFWLELPPGLGPEIREQFEKYILVDQVEIRPLEGWLPVGLAGPTSPALLESLGHLPSAPWSHTALELGGRELRLVRDPELGVPAWTLWLPSDDAEALLEALLERGVAHGLRPVGFEAFETLRIEAGRPRFGIDFGPDHFPQETGLESEAVSYTKGCYLGQEVVARIHYRGSVNRQLCGLLLPAGAQTGSQLLHEGREAGTLGSAADSPLAGRRLGLAIVHKRATEPGTLLEIEGGGEAEISPLPFSSTAQPGGSPCEEKP